LAEDNALSLGFKDEKLIGRNELLQNSVGLLKTLSKSI
jgi:hypothetical protein